MIVKFLELIKQILLFLQINTTMWVALELRHKTKPFSVSNKFLNSATDSELVVVARLD